LIFFAAAARSEPTISKSRNLIGAFNNDEVPVSGATTAVPAIAASPLPGQENSVYQFASLFDDLRSSAGSDEAEEAKVIAAAEIIADFQQSDHATMACVQRIAAPLLPWPRSR
jgi:hypothetical protein